MTDAAVAALAEDTCSWCGTDEPLRRTTYKDDTALVCPDCGTPTLRLF
jgi:DNA-directed RNA polymerase subunit RPC12/RpoP